MNTSSTCISYAFLNERWRDIRRDIHRDIQGSVDALHNAFGFVIKLRGQCVNNKTSSQVAVMAVDHECQLDGT